MFSDMNGDFFCVCTCKNEKNVVLRGHHILEATEKKCSL